MGKVAQSKSELQSHLREQLGFIIKSCREYDGGDFTEAKRIATSIRVLLHDTKHSKSLFSQLGLKAIGFLNTAVPIADGEKHAILGLLQTRITVNDNLTLSGRHHPLLSFRPEGWPPAKKRLFPDWWNQIVLTDTESRGFSRRSLVMAVANTDGGAHVDPELDAGYAALSRSNSIGYAIGVNDVIDPIDKSELASIRQIAHEIIVSVSDRHPELFPSSLPYEIH
jgi:hypothetical protein